MTDEDVVDADQIRASSVAVVVKTPMVQVIWPMVNESESSMFGVGN
jgi:hypothetical protein